MASMPLTPRAPKASEFVPDKFAAALRSSTTSSIKLGQFLVAIDGIARHAMHVGAEIAMLNISLPRHVVSLHLAEPATHKKAPN